VGRDGWKSERIRKRLQEDEHVTWLKDVSDRELPTLYRGAMFTVVASALEGWGLPVSESLSHGVPCLATRAGGLEEAGRGLATYVEPNDSQALEAALWKWIGDPQALSKARTQIAVALATTSFRPTWDDTAATILREAFKE
jgi:glycosyltransferase involved in cell wall biosynthesis